LANIFRTVSLYWAQWFWCSRHLPVDFWSIILEESRFYCMDQLLLWLWNLFLDFWFNLTLLFIFLSYLFLHFYSDSEFLLDQFAGFTYQKFYLIKESVWQRYLIGFGQLFWDIFFQSWEEMPIFKYRVVFGCSHSACFWRSYLFPYLLKKPKTRIRNKLRKLMAIYKRMIKWA